jgi:hypothetical protein
MLFLKVILLYFLAICLLKAKKMKLGLYQHCKGNLYQVWGVSRHSETLEEYVVYQALYGDYGLWVRPKKMFLEILEVDGIQVPRFKLLSENLANSPHIRKI